VGAGAARVFHLGVVVVVEMVVVLLFVVDWAKVAA